MVVPPKYANSEDASYTNFIKGRCVYRLSMIIRLTKNREKFMVVDDYGMVYGAPVSSFYGLLNKRNSFILLNLWPMVFPIEQFPRSRLQDNTGKFTDALVKDFSVADKKTKRANETARALSDKW